MRYIDIFFFPGKVQGKDNHASIVSLDDLKEPFRDKQVGIKMDVTTVNIKTCYNKDPQNQELNVLKISEIGAC